MLRWNTAQPINLLNHMRVTQSLQGIALPLVFGTQRVPGLLVWYGDFKSQKHNVGGKAIGMKGSAEYTYSASWIAALCQGPIFNVRAIWDQSGAFVPNSSTASETIPSGGGPVTLSGFSGSLAGSGGVADGSGNPLTYVPWQGGTPPAYLSSGQYTIDPATGNYWFYNGDAGNTVSIAYNYWSNGRVTQEEYLSSGTGEVIVTHSGTAPDSSSIFRQDLGVFDATTGAAITGYSVSGGDYTGLPANTLVIIRYVYYDYNDDQFAPQSLSFTVFQGTAGQAAWSYMTAQHPDYALGYDQTAYVAFENSYLGSSGQMPPYSFEVQGMNNIGYGGGGIYDDSPPIDDFYDLLTNPDYGIGYPAAKVDNLTWYTNADSASGFTRGALLLISQAITNQETLASISGRWLEACQVAAFYSEGMLKLKPFADEAVSSAFGSYTPSTTPLVSFTDDDYLIEGKNSDPVTLTRTPWADAYNRVQVNFLNRLNAYNSDLVYANDEASIQRYGIRIEPPQQYDFVTGIATARAIASMRVRRLTSIRNSYTFRVPIKYEFLEPMDLVSITDARLGLNTVTVRITQIENDQQQGLTITAEEYPGGGQGTPAAWGSNAQTPAGHPTTSTQPAGRTFALVVQAPYSNANQTGTRFYLFCQGEDPNWAGCVVWVSLDGSNYTQLGLVTTPARLGKLTAAYASITPAPAGPFGLTFDSTHTLSLQFGFNLMAPNTLTATPTPGNPTGEWDSGYPYALGDACKWDGDLWLATTSVQGIQPTLSTPQWQLISSSQPAGVELSAVTDVAAQALASLSALVELQTDGKTPKQLELIAYRDVAAGSSANTYNLTNIYRGAYGSKIQAFAAGDFFARMDEASITYEASPELAGKTIYFRFTAWNQAAGTNQDLSNADTIEAVVSSTPGAVLDMGVNAASANAQSGNYTLADSDFGNLIPFTNMTPVVLTLNHTSQYRQGMHFSVQNNGTSTVTITPTAPDTIDGAATLVLQPGQGVSIYTQGGNWFSQKGGAGLPIAGVRHNTATTDTIAAGDVQHLVTENNSGAVAVAIDDAATLKAGFWCQLQNLGTGDVTLTPYSGQTIDGASSLVLHQNQGIALWSDGANVFSMRGIGGSIPTGVRHNTATTDTIANTDVNHLVTEDNAGAVAMAVNASLTLGAGFWCQLENLGAGDVTITPNGTETIDGAATLVLHQNQGLALWSDGSNLFTCRGVGGGGGASIGGVKVQSGPTYTVLTTDQGLVVALSYTNALAVTLPAANTFPAGFVCWLLNLNVGIATLTPSAGTINGAASLDLGWYEGVMLFADTVNNVWVAHGGVFPSGVDAQTGTSYTIPIKDFNKLISFNNSSAVAVTLQSAATAGPRWYCKVVNLGSGLVTITPSSGTIDGASNLKLGQNQGVEIFSDGSNYTSLRGLWTPQGGTVPLAAGQVFPDYAPASPSAYDDEFNGSGWDPKWTVAADTFPSTFKKFNTRWPSCVSINEFGTLGNYDALLKQTFSWVTGQAFAITAKFLYSGRVPYMGCYLHISDSANSNEVRVCIEYDGISGTPWGSAQVTYSHKVAGTWTYGVYSVTTPGIVSHIYLHLERHGPDNTFQAFVSMDGYAWFPYTGFVSETNLVAITNGYMAFELADNGGSASGAMLGIDWFRYNWISMLGQTF